MELKTSSNLKIKSGGRTKLDMDLFLGRVLQILVSHNSNDVTVSLISRLSGVPRSTIYYYFGKDLNSLFEQAIKLGMKVLVNLYEFDTEINHPTWEAFQHRRIVSAIATVQQYPFGPTLYFRLRKDVGYAGTLIREIEESYIQNMSRVWKKYHGQVPNEYALRFTSYLKLGLLMGITSDHKKWAVKKEDLSDHPLIHSFVQAVTLILKNGC